MTEITTEAEKAAKMVKMMKESFEDIGERRRNEENNCMLVAEAGVEKQQSLKKIFDEFDKDELMKQHIQREIDRCVRETHM